MAKPPFPWIGGKEKIAPYILQTFPAKLAQYVEPFGGSGAVLLTDAGRRTFLQKWQERKKETITHPFLDEKMPWGLVPYVQSLLLARYLRGDLEDYPPFLWK